MTACDATLQQHNICWSHSSRAPPISELHFHHLLGTEFHHSWHSCSLPPLLFLLLPPPPLVYNQVCPDSYYCLSRRSGRFNRGGCVLFLCGGYLHICMWTCFLVFFPVIELDDSKVAREGGMCRVVPDWHCSVFAWIQPGFLRYSCVCFLLRQNNVCFFMGEFLSRTSPCQKQSPV